MPLPRQVLLLLCVAVLAHLSHSQSTRPNIIVILADDLGWNDVGFHGSNEAPTPNIDALAYDGLILGGHYSQSLCTPSRSALLTGLYPIHTGMQHNVILAASPYGLPLQLTLMPEYLNKLGYTSHALGKWHLGFYQKQYTPTFRGFASHYGFWNGYHDYFSHITQASFSPFEGYDMRRNMSVDWPSAGHYTTRLLTEEAENIIERHDESTPLFLYMAHLGVHAGSWEHPLQAPRSTLKLFSHIKDPERRTYLSMIWELDQSVARVVLALKKKKILNNSIIVFLSDNGAPTKGIHKNTGSNFPLRGEKSTPWEGALRTPAFIWSNYLKQSRGVLDDLFHITDWLPTLFSAAGGEISDLGKIDGINQWDYLNGNSGPKRDEILHNIDDIYRYAVIRSGPFKYINGTTFLGFLDGWSGLKENPNRQYSTSSVIESPINVEVTNFSDEQDFLNIRSNGIVKCKRPFSKSTQCNPLKKPCLFNIAKDPCERENLYDRFKRKAMELEKKINNYRQNMMAPRNKRAEHLANPARYNKTWVNWVDFQK